MELLDEGLECGQIGEEGIVVETDLVAVEDYFGCDR